jgi:hypothetical protein
VKFKLALMAAAAAIAAAGAARAHHSFAMFDQERPIEIAGVVVDFRYTNPHSLILVDVKDKDGESTVWNLEGPPPSMLVRDGVTAKTIKPGDELILMIDPLRTGAAGGAWSPRRTWFKDWRPIVAP